MQISRLACALTLALCASAAVADGAKDHAGPPLRAGDALGLAVFGDGKVAYEKARTQKPALAATQKPALAATEKPAPPAKIASDE